MQAWVVFQDAPAALSALKGKQSFNFYGKPLVGVLYRCVAWYWDDMACLFMLLWFMCCLKDDNVCKYVSMYVLINLL